MSGIKREREIELATVLGLDLGTSCVKAQLFHTDGSVIASASAAYAVQRPEPGYAEQDMTTLSACAMDVLREVATHSSQADLAHLQGIGVTGQMHGLVMLDAHLQPLRPAMIWSDTRSAKQVEELLDRFPDYPSYTGNLPAPGFLLPSLLWVRDQEPKLFRRLRHVLLPKDYICHLLCGGLRTDASDASGTGAFCISKRDWAYPILDALALSRSYFPPIASSSEVVGRLQKDVAARTGLPVHTPVVIGGGDTPVMAAGCGLTRPGMWLANMGTGAQLLCVSEQPWHDALYRSSTFCHVQDGQYLLAGTHLNGGNVLQWLRGLLELDYDALEQLAAQAAPGSGGVLFLPYLHGERTPWHDAGARGIFCGLSPETGRAELVRAVYEGLALSLRTSRALFAPVQGAPTQLLVAGGAMRAPILRQIMADVFQCPVASSAAGEAGCRGAAMLAGVGTGVWESLSDAADHFVPDASAPVQPNPAPARVYGDAYARFVTLYANNK